MKHEVKSADKKYLHDLAFEVLAPEQQYAEQHAGTL